jgi:radical SAM protein with 4Fe4S-binding SPASM domain
MSKILFFVEAEQGLGHIIRSQNLIDEIKQISPEADIVCLTNTKLSHLFKDCRTIERSDVLRQNHISQAGQLNEVFDSVFIPIVEEERPDIIVFDTFYSVNVCKKYPEIRKVLILRKYYDNDLNFFFNENCYSLFDLVLIPHEKEEFARVQVPKSPNILFVGPIVRKDNYVDTDKIKAKYGISEGDFVVLATAGGGGFADAADFVNCCLEAFGAVKKSLPKVKFIMLTGPFFQQKIDSTDIKILEFDEDFTSLLAVANLVVSQAGYNSINELAYYRKRAIIIPSKKPNDDQFERAEYAKRFGFEVLNGFDAAQLKTLIFGTARQDQIKTDYRIITGNYFAAWQILNLPKQQVKFNLVDGPYRLRLWDRCNNNCLFCQVLPFKSSDEKSFESIRSELLGCKNKGYREVILPCNTDIRADLHDILAYAKKLGLKTVLETNGRMFSYRDFAERTSGLVDRFDVFLNGSQEVHDKISSADAFEQAMQGISNLIGLGADTQVNTVITNYNYNELKNTILVLKDLGVKAWRPIFPVLKEPNQHIPEVSECYEQLDEAIKFAREQDIDVVTGEVFYNPFIPDHLNLTADNAYLAYEAPTSPKEESTRNKWIDWEVTGTCNYWCSYCGLKQQRADSVYVHKHEAVISQLKRLPGIWNVMLYGGEPLIVENISQIVRDVLEKTQHKVSFVTNLSPDIVQLKKIFDLPAERVAFVTASFHSEFSDANTFFDKAIKVNDFLKTKGIKFSACTVAIKGRLSDLKRFGERFKQAGIEFELQPLRTGACFAKYSDDEKSIFSSFGRTFGLEDLNFKGRRCYAGAEYFALSPNGDAWRCYASKIAGSNDEGFLGNVYDGTFQAWEGPRECPYDFCPCVTPYAQNIVSDKQPKISIIIPTYNRKELLEPALMSLFNQDYPKNQYEIIVVDDGSNDGTMEMVKQLSPTCSLKYIYWPRAKPYVFGEPGNRAGPARNLGVKNSQGELLLFWDSDMVAAPDMLKQHLENYDSNKETVVLGLRKNLKAEVSSIDLKQRVASCNLLFTESELGPNTKVGRMLAALGYDIMNFQHPWFFVISNNLLMKRKLFDSVGSFAQDFVFWGDEDQELGYRIWKRGATIVTQNLALGYHQYHPDESKSYENFLRAKKIHLNLLYKKFLDISVYGFQRHYLGNISLEALKVPLEVSINLTNRCDKRCAMCFESPESRKTRLELSLNEMKSIIDQLRTLGVNCINLSGGEPTLHPDLLEIITYASNKQMKVNVNTSGSFDSKFAESLVASGMDSINFSLDFCDEKKHDEFRGYIGLYDRVLANIKALKSKVLVNVKAVVMAQNLEDLPELARFVYNLGINGITLQAFDPFFAELIDGNIRIGTKQHIDMKLLWVQPEQYELLDRVIDELVEFKKQNNFIRNSYEYLSILKQYFRTPDNLQLGIQCPSGNYFGIHYDGKVMPCWGIGWNVGNAKDEPLKDILSSKPFILSREVMQKCQIPCLLECYSQWNQFPLNLEKSKELNHNGKDKYPSIWKIEPTTKCNLKCPACPTGKGLVPTAEMPFEQFQSIVDNKGRWIKTLLLWGYGEPLLHKNIFKMIKYAKDKGVPFVKTSTNCHFLSKPRIKHLLGSGLDHLIVCLDGVSEETYTKYRKEGNFNKVLRNIRFLIQEKHRRNLARPVIELQFIIMSHNEHEIPEVKKLAQDLGVDRLVLKKVGILPEDNSLLPKNPEYNRYSHMPKPDEKCPLPWNLVFIRADGSVNVCYCLRTDMGEEYVMGNAFKEDLSLIWNNEKYRKLREQMSSARLQMSICASCPSSPGNLNYDEIEFGNLTVKAI